MAKVLANARYWSDGLVERGFKVVRHGDLVTPIVPVLVEDDWKAGLLWKALYDAGVFVNTALHPAVPPGGALLRTSVMATHDTPTLDRALDAFAVGQGVLRGRARPASGPRRRLIRRPPTHRWLVRFFTSPSGREKGCSLRVLGGHSR